MQPDLQGLTHHAAHALVAQFEDRAVVIRSILTNALLIEILLEIGRAE